MRFKLTSIALQNPPTPIMLQVCIVATGVVGDLCRALEQDILPYCQHIIGWLMVNLEGAEINR